jgi:glutaminyl-tRNA synthetase
VHRLREGRSGRVAAVLANGRARHEERHAGADAVKVKGTITWVGADDCAAPRCVSTTACSPSRSPMPAARTSRRASIRKACASSTGYVEASLAERRRRQRFQIERHGYFVTERHDHAPGRPVLNRIAPLRETWTPK